ncbi:hypothetical protein IKX12_01910 [Candidatus Saccharibacteria bacterium]|nr:hypothetical protein [Candidatus Saccharibacteria bacterium]
MAQNELLTREEALEYMNKMTLDADKRNKKAITCMKYAADRVIEDNEKTRGDIASAKDDICDRIEKNSGGKALSWAQFLGSIFIGLVAGFGYGIAQFKAATLGSGWTLIEVLRDSSNGAITGDIVGHPIMFMIIIQAVIAFFAVWLGSMFLLSLWNGRKKKNRSSNS